MNPQVDDVTLTAYALDELPEDARRKVEEVLAHDEAAREFVEQTRATAAAVTGALRAEAAVVPTSPPPPIACEARRKTRALRRPFVWAAAASVAIAVGGAVWTTWYVHARSLRDQVAAGQSVNATPDNLRQIGQARLLDGAAATSPVAQGGPHAFVAPSSNAEPELWANYANSSLEKPSPKIAAKGMAAVAPLAYAWRDRPLTDGIARQTAPEIPGHFPGDGSGAFNTSRFDHINENGFLAVLQNPLSTFSLDVDTASYAIVRRSLNQGQLPPADAVRIEELVNYFPYHYPPPGGDAPFSSAVEVAACPWNPAHRLVRVAVKGREVAADQRPASNLVFLIDVSGSMMPRYKLPMLKRAMAMLVERLNENDHVAIAVYAGNAGLVLPSTACDDAGKQSVLNALSRLEAGGSTNGAQGIELAYQLASEHFVRGGVNRVILCTDGDFNVGVTDQGSLVRMIQEKAKSGVALSVLGVGYDNLNDATIVKLADKGNGNYAYLDSLDEAKKVLVDQLSGTLVTIAKDVKVQVEFNPARVAGYRLIGYEKRLLAKEDFNDDTKDAGEIGAGHTVTAFYEVIPAGAPDGGAGVDPLKYQSPATAAVTGAASDEMLTLKIRYKDPDGDASRLLEFPVVDPGKPYDAASEDFKFAAAVASFGMILRDSPAKGTATLDRVAELARAATGADEDGYRREFLELVAKAKALK